MERSLRSAIQVSPAMIIVWAIAIYRNVFVERLWRSVKYEDIYPNGYATMMDANQGLTRYFVFYNDERPHQALKYRTPAEVHAEVVQLNQGILVH